MNGPAHVPPADFSVGQQKAVEDIVERSLADKLERLVETIVERNARTKRQDRFTFFTEIANPNAWARRGRHWVALSLIVIAALFGMTSLGPWFGGKLQEGFHVLVGTGDHRHDHRHVDTFGEGTQAAIEAMVTTDPNPIGALIDKGLRDRPTLVFHDTEVCRRSTQGEVRDDGCTDTIDWLTQVVPRIPSLNGMDETVTRTIPKPDGWKGEWPRVSELERLNRSNCVVTASVQAPISLTVPFFARIHRINGKAGDRVTLALHVRRSPGAGPTTIGTQGDAAQAAETEEIHVSHFARSLKGLSIRYEHESEHAIEAHRKKPLLEHRYQTGGFTLRDGFWMLELNELLDDPNLSERRFWDHAHSLTIAVDEEAYARLLPEGEGSQRTDSDAIKEATHGEVLSVSAFVFVNRPAPGS